MTAATTQQNDGQHNGTDGKATAESKNDSKSQSTRESNEVAPAKINKETKVNEEKTISVGVQHHDNKEEKFAMTESPMAIEIDSDEEATSQRKQQRKKLEVAINNAFTTIRVKKEKLQEAEMKEGKKEAPDANAAFLWPAVDNANVAQRKKNDEESMAVKNNHDVNMMDYSYSGKRKTHDWASSSSDETMEPVEETTETETKNDRSTNYFSVLDDRNESLKIVPIQVRAKARKDKEESGMTSNGAEKETLVEETASKGHQNPTRTATSATDESSIDRSEASYKGTWETVDNNSNGSPRSREDKQREVEVEKKAVKSVLKKPGEQQMVTNRATIGSNLPTHVSIGGRKVSKKNHTVRTLTNEDVQRLSMQEPVPITEKIMGNEEDNVKFVYRIQFELQSTKGKSHNDVMQMFFEKLGTHDQAVAMKPYYRDRPTNDITTDMTIPEQCWTKARFNMYFSDVWSTAERLPRPDGSFTLYGKMRIESSHRFDEIRGRFESWMRQNRHYIKQPYIQTERVVKLGVLLGSAMSQYRVDVQKQLEEAVHQATGRYIKIDVQKKNEKYENAMTHDSRRVGILTIQVEEEKSDDAEKGLRKVLAKGIPSPCGRCMVFLRTRDRTSRAKHDFNMALTRQAELASRERSTATSQLQNIHGVVRTTENKTMTIQQVICGLKSKNGGKVFTGAERLGDTGRVLLTYDVSNENQAIEIRQNIVNVLCSLILQEDHPLIADESKRASRETLARARDAQQRYLDDIRDEWSFNYQNDDGSMSSLSSTGSSTTEVTIDNEWKPPARANPSVSSTTRSSKSSGTVVNAWNATPKVNNTRTAGPSNEQSSEMKKMREQLRSITARSNAAEKEMKQMLTNQTVATETMKAITGTLQQQQNQLDQQHKQMVAVKKTQEEQLKILQQILVQLEMNASGNRVASTTNMEANRVTQVLSEISQVTETQPTTRTRDSKDDDNPSDTSLPRGDKL